MKKEIQELIKNLPNLSKAYLFGSRAKNTHNDDSDYDICIVIKDLDKDLVFKTITDYMIANKDFIQPLVLTDDEFNEKIQIEIYKREIVENGKLIA
ncbi:nucleotidyltransferase domain-containing protein [Ulvibacter antarcticus]|uniref:Nucleotidyltransferase-like protein n=1 Tax=Ulvibacter antarcticus TaxID=442714 RepID=A0A3L9YNR0_9FLAO|nr:nucleotidyltransferase domain-containing protein [Ulvibacter antarcticus]RMA56292.1 nucleotidyltransferase-like protein [Ulvibacter antarcticus]